MILSSTWRKLVAKKATIWRVDTPAFHAAVSDAVQGDIPAGTEHFATRKAAEHYASNRDGTAFGAKSKPTITPVQIADLIGWVW